MPPDLTNQQAATAYINPLTAWIITTEYTPAPPAPVVVNTTTSAISQIIIQILNQVSMRLITLTRQPDILD